MKRLLQEPLLHFLLLGAGLFAAFSLLPGSGRRAAPGTIVITQGQLASIMDGFTRARQRPPTRLEWEGLIRARVREEVYYREALALGLDKDDAIIRRRLQQKMEFLSDDVVAPPTPSGTELNAFLQTHPDKFRIERQFTFRQLYLDPERHGANLARDAAALLATVSHAGADTDPTAKGDPFILGYDFNAMPAGEIARQFGEGFATKLALLQQGQWQGPVESAFGLHLVFIRERTDGRLPALAEVRDAVRREWDDAQRSEANESFYRQMLQHYTVTIEQPAPDVTKAQAER